MKQEIPEYIVQHLEKLRTHNKELELLIDATAPRDPLILEIIESLKLADKASHPQQSLPIDNQRVSGTKDRRPPGHSTNAARRVRATLRKNLEDAVRRFHIAAEHDWFPPRPDKEPTRRCMKRECSAKDRRVPKYVGPRTARIEMVTCQLCGNKLYDT